MAVLISPGSFSTTSDDYASIPLSGLRPGATLRSPIFEDGNGRNVLLLSAGTRLSVPLLEKLKQRNVQRIRVHRSELAGVTGTDANGQRTSVTPRLLRDSQPEVVCATLASTAQISAAVRPRGVHPFSAALAESFHESHQKSVIQLDNLLQGLSMGNLENSQVVVDISNQCLQQMLSDLDLFLSLGIVPTADTYPGRHSIQVAKLAMAMGAVMGLSADSLLELSLGCLIHDAGMLRIDRDLFQSERKLQQVEFLEITKHPAITFELVRNVDHLTTGARMVAYQMHERWNGTGYPRQRQGRNIHPLARIAAVADVYVALVSPRPYRPGLLPYLAIEQILRGAKSGAFDPDAVRGLLRTLSLFPVGSYVQTNDARVGRVLRSNRELFARPVLELWPADQLWTPPEVVDLAQMPNVSVTRPLADLPTDPAAVRWE